MKSETLSSIATRIGISVTTVSRVLSGRAGTYRISRKTCETVVNEAAKCGYSVDKALEEMRHKSDSRTIALLIPSLSYNFFSDIARTVIAEFKKIGYHTLLVDTREDEDELNSSIESLISKQVEGIIAAPCGNDPTRLEQFSKQVPLVILDRYFENSSLPYVTANNYEGALLATRKLLEAGHRRIACIQGPDSLMTNKERVRGFLDAMKIEGCEDKAIIVGNEFSFENGYFETNLLLGRDDKPTAIFALNCTILLGTLKAVKEAGLSIPDDLSVISFDDYQYMDYLLTPICRISQPTNDLAVLASKLLMDMMENGTQLQSHIKLSAKYVDGESIRKANPK